MIDFEDNGRRAAVKRIAEKEIGIVNENPSIIRSNGCAACHILFTLANKMKISEQDAADLLSEALLDNNQLNDRFIELVENVHMKQRTMGRTFALKSREAKDMRIESQFKNTLNEILGDASDYVTDCPRTGPKFGHRLSRCYRRIVLLYEEERYGNAH